MAWWQWPFFGLGVVAALMLAAALAIVGAPQLLRGAERILRRPRGRPEQPQQMETSVVPPTEGRVG